MNRPGRQCGTRDDILPATVVPRSSRARNRTALSASLKELPEIASRFPISASMTSYVALERPLSVGWRQAFSHVASVFGEVEADVRHAAELALGRLPVARHVGDGLGGALSS
jgi:hypothetical protein